MILFITSRCNARCKMCFYYGRPGENELSLEEIRRVSRTIPSFPWLIITGGEPFLREDLPEVCEIFCKQNNVEGITIPTNGFLPDAIETITERILRQCERTQFRVNLSIDDLYEKHDEIRGVEGGFKKLLVTYEKLRSLSKKYKRLEIGSVLTVSHYNQENLMVTYNFLTKKFSPKDIVINLVRGQTRESDAKDVDIRKYEELVKLHEKDLLKAKKPYDRIIGTLRVIQYNQTMNVYNNQKSVRSCYAGRLIVVVDELGNVYPCELLNFSFGNLRDHQYNFGSVWNSTAANGIRELIKQNRCFCTHECFMWINLISCPFSAKDEIELVKF